MGIFDFGFSILDLYDVSRAKEVAGYVYEGEDLLWRFVMDEATFKRRTKALALRVIKLCATLPPSDVARHIGRQLLRCGTSVGANYRAACRARSRADMAAKLAIVEEEADETLYWLELLVEAELLPSSRVAELQRETNEILAMVIASRRTLRNQLP